jgi:hypothetical protein
MSTANFSFENVLFVVQDTDNYDDFDYDILKESVIDDCYTVLKDGYIPKRLQGLFAIDIYSGGKLYKTITVHLNSGYYSGLNLDYSISEQQDDFKGTKTLEKQVDKITRKLCNVFSLYAKEAMVAGRLSSGECLYNYKK